MSWNDGSEGVKHWQTIAGCVRRVNALAYAWRTGLRVMTSLWRCSGCVFTSYSGPMPPRRSCLERTQQRFNTNTWRRRNDFTTHMIHSVLLRYIIIIYLSPEAISAPALLKPPTGTPRHMTEPEIFRMAKSATGINDTIGEENTAARAACLHLSHCTLSAPARRRWRTFAPARPTARLAALPPHAHGK